MESTIELRLKMEESQNRRFKYYFDNQDFYESPEYFQAYYNWRKCKSNDATDLFENLATGFIKSGFDGINYVLLKSKIDKTIRKSIDDVVKQAVKESGGEWHD